MIFIKKLIGKIFLEDETLITLNKFVLILEIKLLTQFIKQYTFRQIITAYPSVILNEIWIRLFTKNK